MKITNQSVELLDYMGSDLAVVNAARVSFHKTSEWEDPEFTIDQDTGALVGINDRLSDKDQKLIAYLAKHGHWSPFAHCFLSFRIKSPIFVARQLVKHQVGLAWNEVSRRYVDDEPEFYFPQVWRGKPINAKQGSSGVIEDEWAWSSSAKEHVKNCLAWYDAAISAGMAPEQARMVLPQNMMTEWIWSGSLMAFARVCNLRLDSHAQQETQEIAKQINSLIPEEFKWSWKALVGESIE